MSCETVIGSIVALLDGELAGAERRAVEVHLAGCAACQSELAELRRTRALVEQSLDGLEASVVRTSFEQLWARAEGDGHPVGDRGRPASRSEGSGASRIARRRIVWAGAGGLALAASLALMLIGVPRQQGVSPMPVPDDAAGELVAHAPAPRSEPRAAEPVVVAAKPAAPPARVPAEASRDEDPDLDEEIEQVELPADEAAVVSNELDPPRELLERPEMFLNYPIVRKLDELRHLESVLADSPDPTEQGGAG